MDLRLGHAESAIVIKFSALNITGVLAAVLAASSASAADLVLSPQLMANTDVDLTLPAVSGPNGKWEFYLGPTSPGSFSARAAGSVSLPVGERFGIQLDGAVSANSASSWLIGGVVHAFTRDPDSYLLGVATGVVRGPTGTLGVLGVEGELYIDDFSLEAWVGVAGIDYDVLPDVAGLMALADAAYYFNDDFRASVGLQHMLGVSGLHIAAEYQLAAWQLPLSATAEARINTDGSYSLMAGLKGYFGGDQKSLKDRHRQDDPPNRALSLFAATGGLLSKTATPSVACSPSILPPSGSYAQIQGNGCAPSDPEAFCVANGYDAGMAGGTFGDGECFNYLS